MLLKRRELNVPVRLQLVQPGLHGDQGLRAEPEEAGACVGGSPLVGDDARLEQHPQVPAHGRRRDADCSRQLSSPARSFAEQFNNVQPGWVCQRLEYGYHLGAGGRRIVAHAENN